MTGLNEIGSGHFETGSGGHFRGTMHSIVFVPHGPSKSPYNARLTREAVAPFRPAWKGRTEGGSGATFAVRPNPKTHPSKGRDGLAESVLNRLLYGGAPCLFVFKFDFVVLLYNVAIYTLVDCQC